MIIEKIQKGKLLKCKDLSPAQKVLLADIMEKYGASRGFTYDRFFKEGFREWEILGIDHIKTKFIAEHQKELWTQPEEDGTTGYAGVLSESEDYLAEDGSFYRLIGRVTGLKSILAAELNRLGMGTNMIYSRFVNDKWRPFQRMGIAAIVEEFELKCHEQKDQQSA